MKKNPVGALCFDRESKAIFTLPRPTNVRMVPPVTGSMVAAEVNHDGKTDLIVSGELSLQNGGVCVLLNATPSARTTVHIARAGAGRWIGIYGRRRLACKDFKKRRNRRRSPPRGG